MSPAEPPQQLQTPSPLLRLPGELRILIYRALFPFPTDKPLKPHFALRDNFHSDLWSAPQTGLFSTCHLLNSELTHFLYALHAFDFSPSFGAMHIGSLIDRDFFLQRLRPETAATIGRLKIRLYDDMQPEHAEALFPNIGNVETVEVKVLGVWEYGTGGRRVGDMCRRIEWERRGKRTVWDDGGDSDVKELFRRNVGSDYVSKGE